MGLVKKHQSLVGGLLWIQRQSRPDLTAMTHLLSRCSHDPSEGHCEAGKRALACLKGTLDRGIRFTQGGSPAAVNMAFPIEDGICTDVNWGPQDASHPKGDETVTIEEAQSLLGHVITRMGGPLVWGCARETNTMSLSSCESEMHATNEGAKCALTIRNLSQDLGLADIVAPAPLCNDNRGCADWTKGVSVSKKLRHFNVRELSVHLHQQSGHIAIRHVEGKSNIADLFAKEIKDSQHFCQMAFVLTAPQSLSHWDPLAGETLTPAGDRGVSISSLEAPGACGSNESCGTI